MKPRLKPDLIIWMHLLLSLPLWLISIAVVFNILFLPQHLAFDTAGYLVLYSLLVIFIATYVVLSIKYKYSIVFTKTNIVICDKYKGNIKIDYEDVIKVEFIKTPFYIWPIFIFTEGNRLIIRYVDENKKEKIYGRKVYTYKIRQLMKSKLIEINYVRLKEADKKLFKK